MKSDCARQASGVKDCPCTYAGCPRHGNCCQCVAYHRVKNQLPACYFSKEAESVYDRSVEFYIASRVK